MRITLTKFLFVTACAAGVLAAQGSSKPAENVIAEIFLAKSNAEGKAGESASEFLVTDIPIYCVVRFTAPGVANVRMDLVAANVPGVTRESNVVSISYTTKENEDRVNFSGRPQGEWVAGSYRVDVFVGQKKVRKIEFEIKEVPAGSAKPADRGPAPPKRKYFKRTRPSDRDAVNGKPTDILPL